MPVEYHTHNGIDSPVLDVNITEDGLILADTTNLNVSSTKHGFAPKSPADATKFLNGATTPDYAQVKDSDLSLSDIATNNVSTTKHGFAPKAPNNRNQVLLGDATWGPLPLRIPISTAFETAGRFSRTVGPSGSAITFGTAGMELGIDLTGGAPTYAKTVWLVNGLSSLGTIYAAGHAFRTRWEMNSIDPNAATRYSSFFGFGQPTVAATGHTYTDPHIGFKAIYNGSSIALSATCADGTEATASLTTMNGIDDVCDVYFDIISASLVNFYWNKNDGGWSSAVPIITHIPTSLEQSCQFSYATDNVDRGGRLTFFGASYI